MKQKGQIQETRIGTSCNCDMRKRLQKRMKPDDSKMKEGRKKDGQIRRREDEVEDEGESEDERRAVE